MTALPIPLPHRVKVGKTGDVWLATCVCGWVWHSRFHRVALTVGQGHLINQARKAH